MARAKSAVEAQRDAAGDGESSELVTGEGVFLLKQIVHVLSSGELRLINVPTPQTGAGALLIRTSASLVSSGTERMLVEFGQANLIAKARSQPDKVKEVLAKIRTDGLATTMDAVRSKLDQPIPLGYCNVGTVIGLGRGVSGFEPGMRVVSNGSHAEVVAVPMNLCVPVPNGVSDEQASFTVLAAIGLQGIRLAEPTLGENAVVIGLGLIGLITAQLLRAQGCRVLGVDPDPARRELASGFGCQVVDSADAAGVLMAADEFARGRGVDLVLITAATKSNEPVTLAAQMSRKRGRIVLVGVTGLELSRSDFYEKELTFQVSCSYGPGRYDPSYEEGGNDYPPGFVRWTAQRNFEAVLDMMADGRLEMGPLVTHRFAFSQAPEAYQLLTSSSPSLGIVLEYPQDADVKERTVALPRATPSAGTGRRVQVSFLGAGNFAGRVLIPAFRDGGAEFHTLVSRGGVTSVHHGKKFGFRAASTDEASALSAPDVDAVVVSTRHDLHAEQVLAALRAGKHVFCEKPLCLTQADLDEIEKEARARPEQLLMLGFNRRFAPHVLKMKSLLDPVPGPRSFIMTVNAGAIPGNHWTQQREVGGGRIVGEACHFIDLLRFLAGSPIVEHSAMSVGEHPNLEVTDDKATILLRFADGSTGVIHYLANGHKSFPKEHLEVFVAGKVLQLDNFRRLDGWGWSGFRRLRSWKQNKGHVAGVKAFLDAVSGGGVSPIPLDEVLEVSRVTLEVAEGLR